MEIVAKVDDLEALGGASFWIWLLICTSC